jgi:hypothetical protein
MRSASVKVNNLNGKQNLFLVFKNAQAGAGDNLFFFSRMVLSK